MVHTDDASPYSVPLAQAQRLVLVAELLHGDDRAEHLVLDDLVVLVQPATTLGSKKKPRSPTRLPAGAHLGVAGQPLDEPADPGQLVGVVQRPEVRVLPSGPPVCSRACSTRAAARSSCDARAGQHPGRGGAVLAGVEVPGDRDRLGGLADVGVVEHDDRRLAAQLEVDPLEVVPRRRGHLACRPARSR